jgi:large subunit ribosomal protein L7e
MTKIPESVLKKVKSGARAEPKPKNTQSRRLAFKRAEAYAKEYLAMERDHIRLNRQAKAAGSFYVAVCFFI